MARRGRPGASDGCDRRGGGGGGWPRGRPAGGRTTTRVDVMRPGRKFGVDNDTGGEHNRRGGDFLFVSPPSPPIDRTPGSGVVSDYYTYYIIVITRVVSGTQKYASRRPCCQAVRVPPGVVFGTESGGRRAPDFGFSTFGTRARGRESKEARARRNLSSPGPPPPPPPFRIERDAKLVRSAADYEHFSGGWGTLKNNTCISRVKICTFSIFVFMFVILS